MKWSEAIYKFNDADSGASASKKLLPNTRNIVSWLPVQPDGSKIKGIVLIAHGLFAHAQAHKKEGIAFAKAGFATYALDHVGHGVSSGDRARINSWKELRDDYIAFAATVQDLHPPGTPVILYCHSMGTLITAHAFSGISNVKAVIFSGFPLVAGPGTASIFGFRCCYPVSKLSFVAKIGACMACLDPTGPTAPLHVEAINSDVASLAEIRRDPRRYHGWLMNVTSARLLEMIDEIKYGTILENIKVPCFLIHGADDEIAYPEGSVSAHAKLGTAAASKSLEILPKIKHEYFSEPEALSGDILARVVGYAVGQIESLGSQAEAADAAVDAGKVVLEGLPSRRLVPV